MINYTDISVVIQGPIIFNSLGKNLTGDVCESVRKWLPGAEIIISTWEGSDTSGLEYDALIINKNIQSNKIKMPYTGELKLYSVNHQLITTLEGIKQASRKYILKLRSDLMLVGNGFIKYFEKYNEYPPDGRKQDWRVFKRRIVTLPTYNIYKENGMPFNICDWFFFGEKEDVKYYFDIPLVDADNLIVRKGEKYPSVEDNFGAEQIMWISCLRKNRDVSIKNALDKSGTIPVDFEKSLALNFVLISAQKAGVLNLTYGVGAYGENPIFSRGMYTLEEWEKLYVLYGGGTIKVKYNIGEHFFRYLYNKKNNFCERHKLFGNVYYRFTKKINRKRLK